MDVYEGGFISETQRSQEEMDVRKGPWTDEEDSMLKAYVHIHGEGRWNSVARLTGLKRTGKSCRLRWLNYLRPEVRRGNISLEEQLLILELHSRWGNRWSKIAQHLPGRTDNEIKNYWRTRVQKQAKQLKCDVNSKKFRDCMRYVWIPRLIERIRATATSQTQSPSGQLSSSSNSIITYTYMDSISNSIQNNYENTTGSVQVEVDPSILPELSGTSSDSQVSSVSDLTDCYNNPQSASNNQSQSQSQWNLQNGLGSNSSCQPTWSTATWGRDVDDIAVEMEFQATEEHNKGWLDGGDSMESVWNEENIWFLQQQLFDEV